MATKVTIQMVVTGTPQALAEFRAANSGAQQFARSANAAFGGLQGTLSAIKTTLASIGLAVGVAQIVSFGAATARSTREAGDQAKALGTVAGRLSALNAVTDLSNEKQEVMAKGLAHLGSNLDALKRGEPAATAAFARLGLKAADFPSDDVALAAEKVARALARMRDGATKSAVAAGVLGEQIGRKLIPVFQKLVDMGGLEGAIAYAKRTGQFVDDATVATLEQLTQATKQLKLEASSAALEFAKGFGPEAVALVNDLSESFDPRGTSAIQSWGAAAGKWARIAVAELRMAYVYADSLAKRGALGAQLSALSMSPGEPGRPLTAQEATDAVIRQRRIQEGLQEQAEIRKRTKARLDAIYLEATDESEIHVAAMRRDQLVDDESYSAGLMRLKKYLVERNNRIRTETFALVTARGNIIKTLEEAGPLTGEDAERVAALRQEIKLLRKEEEQRLAAPPPPRLKRPAAPIDQTKNAAARKAELDAEKAKYDALEAQAKAAYDRDEFSLEEYFKIREELIRRSRTAEIDALRKPWESAWSAAPGQTAKEKLAASPELRKISAEVDAILALQDKDIAGLADEQEKGLLELQNKRLDFEAKYRTAQGDRHEADRAELAKDVAAYETWWNQAQQKSGKLTADMPTPSQYGLALTAKRSRAELQTQLQQDLDSYKEERDLLLREMAAGTIDTLSGNRELLKLEQGRLPALRRLAEQYLQIALSAKDPAAIVAARTLLADIASGEKEAAQRLLPAQLVEGSKAAFVDWARTAADSYDTVGEAATGMAQKVVAALYDIAAAEGATGIWNWVSSLFTRKASGGLIRKKAGGGLISGPGTGTSDSIPAWLSAGEYVVRAAAVRQPGVLPLLEQVNQAPRPAPYQLRVPDWGNTMLRRYAAGGLVLGQRSGPASSGATEFGGGLTLELADGLIARHVKAYMKSPDGVKTQITVIARNRRQLGGILRMR